MPATPPDRCFQALRQTTGAVYAGLAPIEMAKALRGTLPDVLTILMIQRGLSNFESIAQLARHGKIDDALMLGRPLFEDSVLLQHVARKPEDKRNARIVGHQHASWSAWIDALQLVTPEQLHGRNPAELVDEARREIEILDTYCSAHGHSKNTTPLSYRATAVGLGRDRECVAYDISNQLLHTRGVPLAGRFKHVGDGKISLNLRDEHSSALLPLLTYWSASSMLHSLVAVATVMNWRVPEQVDGMFKYLQRMKLFD